jgi:hypothetical protein
MSMDEERYFTILREAAVQRFGEETAEKIKPAMEEMARSLEAVSEYPVETEETPAFYG